MKKLITIVLLMFSCSIMFGQQSYQQYKQQKENEQRYRNEQQQQLKKDLTIGLNNYVTYSKEYKRLLSKYESYTYVSKTFHELTGEMRRLKFEIRKFENFLSPKQYELFQATINENSRLDTVFMD